MVAAGLGSALDDEADVVVVGTAVSVGEVVPAVERLRPDVVLMDFRLGDGDAVDGMAALAAAGHDIPVVIVTGHADVRTVQRAVEAGCAGYLLKEQPIEELARAVRAVAEGGAVFAPAVLPAVLGRRTGGPGHDLTRREAEVLQLLADGASTSDIADRLFLSTNTVRNHVQRLLGKLDAHSKLEAVAIGLREGIVRVGG